MRTKKGKISKLLVAVSLVILSLAPAKAGSGKGDVIDSSGNVSISPVTGKKQAIVSLNKLGEPIVIRIMDSKNNTVYKEVYSKNGVYRKLYDFSVLDAGEYTLNVKTRNEEYSRVIFLEDAYLMANEVEISKGFDPVMDFKNDNLFISFLNEKNKNVSIKLFEYGGSEIYTEESEQVVFQKKYDLTRLQNGLYLVSVSDGENQYVNELVIR